MRAVEWVRRHSDAIVDWGTLALLGGVAFVGSARHVLNLARDHGQDGAAAWLIAGSVEVLAAYCGWELRKRAGWGRMVPVVFLAGSVAFVIGANLASAEDSRWGRALAVTPAVVFLAVVTIAETRHWRRPKRRQKVAAAPASAVKPQVKAPATPPASVPLPVAVEEPTVADEVTAAVPVADRPVPEQVAWLRRELAEDEAAGRRRTTEQWQALTGWPPRTAARRLAAAKQPVTA